MSRRLFVAGNWKMNLNRREAVALAQRVAVQVGPKAPLDVAVCPPFPYLDAVAAAVEGSAVGVGAQDCYHKASGAYTGEVSVRMLKDVGCQFVILGHSERRHVLGETDEQVNEKTLAALEGDLTPIVCVGETLEQREADKTIDVIKTQFAGSLKGLTDAQMATTVIAYEPVWAIGTGKVATPDQAEEVHTALRGILADQYNAQVAGKVRIQYGGSVKPGNAADLLAREDIDGALVGGAALDFDSFDGIIEKVS